MSEEFQRYGFRDFARATVIAPLACIPAAILVDLLLFTSDIRISFPQEGFARFTSGMVFLLLFLLPTAYIVTALCGAFGVLLVNIEKIRPTILMGAVAGLIFGAVTGLLWTLGLTGENFSPAVLVEGFIGTVITPLSILSGLFIGMAYVKLMTRPFRFGASS